ncbi:KinB-signaling pathway activation protein [Anaerobacillus sp. MEB173]|uniref:KinB-signaling pathway activation protein n=1 Tax=Anaerobacillus sp. MEB173 TaxID=3383345 RepID=UPI003F8F155D
MNTRKAVYLFFSTLLIGSVSGTLVGLIVDWSNYWQDLKSGEIISFLLLIVWLMGISAMWSLIAQMGFFAYLTIHRFGLGIFKSPKLWNKVQVVVIAFVIFDLIYFRYVAFAIPEETVLHYSIMPILLLIYGLIIANLKSKATNKLAFVPALFFIVVVTTIEWIPALRVNDPKWLWIYFAPLLTANTWQLLILHKLTGTNNKEKK